MESTQGLPLEVRLSAYLDGQLPNAEIKEIDSILARDEKARSLYHRLKLGSDLGRKAFEEMLHEPVPLDLVRNIKLATVDGAQVAPRSPLAPPKAEKRSYRTWAQIGIAGLVLLAAGGIAGYLLGATQDPVATPVQDATSRSWLDDITDNHRIYARQSRHLVEVPATDSQHITNWLAGTVGVDFAIPDLSDQKLTFEGARLLTAGGKPTAQLIYKDEEGEVFAAYFQKSEPAGQATEMDDSIRDDLGLVSWQKDSASFVVIGPSSDPQLEAIATTVAQAI